MGAYNCLVKSLTVDGSCEEHFGLGTAKVTYILAGDVGNKSTCSFTVTVVDDTAPVIANCPGNVRVEERRVGTERSTQWTTWPSNTATDNCQFKSLTGDQALGTTFFLGRASWRDHPKSDAGN